MSDTVSPAPNGCTARVPIDDAPPPAEPGDDITADDLAMLTATARKAAGQRNSTARRPPRSRRDGPRRVAGVTPTPTDSTILDRLDAVDRLDVGPVAKKAVLRALVRHTDETGFCFPSTGRLAAHAGVHIGTARRCLDELEAEGWFIRERLRRPWDKRYVGYQYVVDVARLLAAGTAPADLDDLDDADERQAHDPAPDGRYRAESAAVPRTERGLEGVTDEGGSFPCDPPRASAAPPAGEGKAEKQQPTHLQRVARRLPASLAGRGPGELYDPTDSARRALLVDELAEAVTSRGWDPDDLADELTARNLAGVGSVVAVLGHRLADLVAAGAPVDPDERAAAEAEAAHAQRLDAAAHAGRTLAAIDIAAGAPPSTVDVDEEAARQFPHDPELRGAYVDAFRAAIARSTLAERPPVRPPAATVPTAPTVPVDDALARIARMRATGLRTGRPA